MKRIKPKSAFCNLKIVSLLVLLLGQGLNALAKDQDCRVDFFEGAQYKGEHFQLAGPVQLKNLKDVNGTNWDSRIDSLKVGSGATLTVFENPDFRLSSTEMANHPELMKSWGITEKDVKEESELVFHPNSMIHDLSDFNFHQKIKSLKIACK
jgi:hypothetical protein